MSDARPPLVEMRGMSISFGGVRAVDDVSLDLLGGEVVGLLGHNGAGKATLIKMLSGAYRPDAGEIRIDGRPAAIHSPRDARPDACDCGKPGRATAPGRRGHAAARPPWSAPPARRGRRRTPA